MATHHLRDLRRTQGNIGPCRIDHSSSRNPPAACAKGWHKIYVAFWDPEFACDGRPLLKFKLSGEPGFRLVDPPARPDTQDATFLEEIYFETADVTGQDLVIGKSNGTLSKNASIAYVKLVALTKDEQAAAEADRAQTRTRNLVATIDGQSYFHVAQFDRPEHILNQIALYQHSDVAKVQWAVCYGSATNFPSKTPGAIPGQRSHGTGGRNGFG